MKNQTLSAGIFDEMIGVDVFSPTGTDPSTAQSILAGLPGLASSILGMLTPKPPEPQKTDYTPFLLLGGAALLIFTLKK